MDPERIAKLNAIGFCWDVRRKTWMVRPPPFVASVASHNELTLHRLLLQDFHAELFAYAAANGGATRVPLSGATTQLARWVREQRERYKEGTLPAERVMLLEQLPSWEWRE